MSFDILNRWTRAVAYHSEKSTQREAILEAVTNKADLRGADLSSAVLSGAYLSGAYLRDAVLSDAVLSDADLRDAVLRDADLRDAVLSGADLSDADLRGADLRDAVLSGADLSDADLRGAVLRGAYLSGAYRTYKLKGPVTHFDCAEWGRGTLMAYIEEEKGDLRIVCGCRHFSIEEATDHWKGREDRKMTRVALEMAKVWYAAVSQKPE